MRIRPSPFLRLSLAAAVLFAAPDTFAHHRATLSISVTVVRSLAVSVEGGPSGPILSVRAPDGVERTTLLRQARRSYGPSSPAPAPVLAQGHPGYLVVTVLADAPP